MKALLKADFLLLSKSGLFRVGVVIVLLFYLYSLNISSSFAKGAPYYYPSQLLIATLSLTLFFIVAIPSYLTCAESTECTWAIRVVAAGRSRVMWSKIGVVVSCCLALPLVAVIIGIACDLSAVEGWSPILLGQYLAVAAALVFWGIVALTTGLLLGNVWLSMATCLGYFYGEQFFSQGMPSSVVVWLPVWNAENTLQHLFDDEGAFGFTRNSQASLPHSAVVFSAYFLLACLALWLVFRRRALE